MKKRIISAVSAATVFLGSLVGVSAADETVLSPRATVEINTESGYLTGITGTVDADFVASQFAAEVSLVAPSGDDVSGDTSVASDTRVMRGGEELARVLISGDLTRDGKISLNDAVSLLKLIAAWDIDVCTAAADANCDGKTDLGDAMEVLKCVAGWNVTLGKSSILSTSDYKLLSSGGNVEKSIIAAASEKGAEISVITEAGDGDRFVAVGVDLQNTYSFIDGDEVSSLPKLSEESKLANSLYVDTYNGNIYITSNDEAALNAAAELIADILSGASALDILRGFYGPLNYMTESGALYLRAVRNIRATEPVTDGTNGMNEDIYVAITNAEYTKPKSFIYMIGDGMGKNIAVAAKAYFEDDLYGGKLAMNYLPYEGRQSTYSASDQTTDSAAGGTALSTGHKTTNGVVGKSKNCDANYKTLLELAAEKGKSTGVIATKCVTDATPASFTAHVPDRGMENEIAAQQLAKLTDGTLDLILGGGKGHYEADTNAEALAAAKAAGVTYTGSWNKVQSSSLPIAGLFASHAMETDSEVDPDEPHIAAMTALAIDLLSEDENGFFLMVEGSKIDSYGHENMLYDEICEAYEFDCAIAVALRYVALNPDTVLIITADHETGGLRVPADVDSSNVMDSSYSYGGHYFVDVPVYAVGYGTEVLLGNNENTDIANLVASLMGEDNFGQTSEVVPLFDLTDKDFTDALLELNENNEAIHIRDDGVLVNYNNGIQKMYLPTDKLALDASEYKNVAAVRVTYTNMGDKAKLIPFFGIRAEDGVLHSTGERITNSVPGETITYTYVLPTASRNSDIVPTAQEILIYSYAGVKTDVLITDISAVMRDTSK